MSWDWTSGFVMGVWKEGMAKERAQTESQSVRGGQRAHAGKVRWVVKEGSCWGVAIPSGPFVV